MTFVRRRPTDWPGIGKGGVVATAVTADGPDRREPAPHGGPALAEVYRAHADFVLRIAGHLGVPEGLRDDVVHDVFLVAHRRLAEFDAARGSLRSWLYGITRRVVMHRHRADGRRARWLCAVPPPGEPAGPEEAVATSRAAAMLETFLAALPEDRRLVFALVDIEGMAVVEVARAVDCNLNTVYGRLRMARLAFASWLDGIERDTGGDHDRR